MCTVSWNTWNVWYNWIKSTLKCKYKGLITHHCIIVKYSNITNQKIIIVFCNQFRCRCVWVRACVCVHACMCACACVHVCVCLRACASCGIKKIQPLTPIVPYIVCIDDFFALQSISLETLACYFVLIVLIVFRIINILSNVCLWINLWLN